MKLPPFLRSLSAFQWALLASAGVHAVLLSIRFVSPDSFNRLFTNLPLEVILVNAQSTDRPENAKTLAQAALVGGGDASAGRATSPLPYSALESSGTDSEKVERKEVTTRDVQNNLLAQLRQQVADIPPLDPRKSEHTAAEIAQEERRLQLLRMLAEIERDVKTENERPRRRYTSPSTQDSILAIYLNTVRNTIAQRGTENFPLQDGKPIFGILVMEVLIHHDGSLISAQVMRSSGNPALDRRAEAIVEASAPFDVFTSEMRRSTDQLGFISSFEFRSDSTVHIKQEALSDEL
ncbi:protein TonB [Lampropedia hyalina DSM 16112]|uniref:Protein TonB n=1 Tax=Lampropedia hyalina DSM 16112 TaxID=1122156 RepID=A0A1M5EMA5_9BURK|nr:energy transducer TonB [Lampropedia hyalina]SHF80337.1 protein TonB [Lampropedia hyalina DSM 16112]